MRNKNVSTSKEKSLASENKFLATGRYLTRKIKNLKGGKYSLIKKRVITCEYLRSLYGDCVEME